MTCPHSHISKKRISANNKKLLRIYRQYVPVVYRQISRWFKLIEDAAMYGINQQWILGKKPVKTNLKKIYYMPIDEIEKSLFSLRSEQYVDSISKGRGQYSGVVSRLVDWDCVRSEGDKRYGTTDVAVYGKAMKQAGQIARVSTSFEVVNQRAVEWARLHTNELVTMITEDIRETLRVVVSEGVRDGQSMPEIGRRIRGLKDAKGHPLIGLNRPQIKALGNYESKLLAEAVSGKKKMTSIKQGIIDRKVRTKARKYRNYRMEMIARTETARAVSAGTLSGYKEAKVRKVRFEASSDPCEVCMGYDGNVYTLREADGMIPGSTHPNCRCVWVPVISSIKE